MGYETKCDVRVVDADGRVHRASNVTVLLETDELIVRGDARVRVPRVEFREVTRRGGTVTVASSTTRVTLTLDAGAAEKWQRKLEEPPKRLIDKLDVKADARVWAPHLRDAPLLAQLAERTPNLSTGRSAAKVDIAFVQVARAEHLTRIATASKAIVPDGAIWVVHPKGAAGIADTTIFTEAKRLGLTYTKVARISEAESAEKLVWPRAARGAK
jgi:hypothetical protein